MLRSRLVEEAVSELWDQGQISGEMHLSTGEEAIAAGIVLQLQKGDALALDHRPTSPLLIRGVDPVQILRELLGRTDGLCRGMGGHMHLFSREHLAASSGIVGASGPAALGFALAGQQLRPGAVAVAFFGEGALNQGMLLESLNLAASWQLPVLFICKDNRWAISTLSPDVTSSPPAARARAFGMAATEGDGSDVRAVWHLGQEALARARRGDGPTLLHLRCQRPEQHMLGDALLRVARRPVQEMRQMAGPLTRAVLSRQGAPLEERAGNLRQILSLVRQIGRDASDQESDPLARARSDLAASDEARLLTLEQKVVAEVGGIVRRALAEETP
jgi:pyruvate dehydrogenase E1 component alpha subunit